MNNKLSFKNGDWENKYQKAADVLVLSAITMFIGTPPSMLQESVRAEVLKLTTLYAEQGLSTGNANFAIVAGKWLKDSLEDPAFFLQKPVDGSNEQEAQKARSELN